MGNRVSFVVIAKDAYTNVARKIGSATDKMNNKFRKLNARMKMTSGRFSKLIAGVSAFTVARAFFLKGTQFEDAIADLGSITGATGKDLKFLTSESLRLAKVNKVAASQTALAFKLVASAKAELLQDPKALSDVTAQVLLLANASGIDLETSARVVTESLNQYGAAANQAGKFVNILAAGSKFGASEVSETGTAVVKSGVAANAANLDFEQLNATIQVLAQRGIKGAVAGTQLKTSLIKLEASGIKKITPSVVGYIKALKNLGDMNLTTAQKSKLFGLEAINTGSVLLDNVDSIALLTEKLRGTSIAQEQASVRLSTFSTKWRGLGIIINGAMIKTFMKLEEKKVFSNIAEDFGKWVSKIDESDISSTVTAVKQLADAVVAVSKGLKISFLLLRGVSVKTGEFIGKVASGNLISAAAQITPVGIIANQLGYDIDKNDTNISDAFSFDEIKKTLGINSEADVNINLKAPANTVESVKTTAKTPNLRVGINMETVPG